MVRQAEGTGEGTANARADTEDQRVQQGQAWDIWGRRFDRAAMQLTRKRRLEFKRTPDHQEEYRERTETRAKEQYEDFVECLSTSGKESGTGMDCGNNYFNVQLITPWHTTLSICVPTSAYSEIDNHCE